MCGLDRILGRHHYEMIVVVLLFGILLSILVLIDAFGGFPFMGLWKIGYLLCFVDSFVDFCSCLWETHNHSTIGYWWQILM